MVKIPETHTPSSISLGRNTPDSLNAIGGSMRNPFADAIDTLGAGLNMFGRTLEREQKTKLEAAEAARKQVWASQLAEYNMVLSNRISDYRAKNDGREIQPDTITQLSNQVYEQAFDPKRFSNVGLSQALSAELREKAREATFNIARSAYNEVQKSNLTLKAKQTTERNRLADESIVQGISNGDIAFDAIYGALEARRIARSEANEPEDITAATSNQLLLDGLKGYVLNNTKDLPNMKGILGGYARFPDMQTGEMRTFKEMVSEKDYLAAKKAYQASLEDQLAQVALNSPEVDIRKMLYVDGMYENESELNAANKRVREKETALKVQRQQALDEENRVGFTNALLGENNTSVYAQQLVKDRGNAEKASNLQIASEKEWKQELGKAGWFDFKKKDQINTALFAIERQKGNAEVFRRAVIWSSESLDYLKITSSNGFKNAGGSQKSLLEDMTLKAQYDQAKQMLPADVDVEALIDKAVKSYDPTGSYGKDYLQPDIRRDLATTLSTVAPNKRDVGELVNRTAAKFYGMTVFKDEKQKTDYDNLVDIIQTATTKRKPKQTPDDVFMSIRNELNDKYDSDIVDRMMPYVISGQYFKAIGVVNALKSR